MLAWLLLATQLLAAEPTPSWIWIDGEGPPNWAPAASRYFRRSFELEQVPASAKLLLTADDCFEAFVNGKRVGTGEDWETVYRFEVAPLLRVGRNVIAVRAENTARGPGALLLRLDGLGLVSDAEFRVGPEGPEGWERPGFDDSDWARVLVIGPVGSAPWGDGPREEMNPSDIIEQIIATHRPDDPVLVVPTPRGELAAERGVRLGEAGPRVATSLVGGTPELYAMELLTRGLAAMGCEAAAVDEPGIHLALQPEAALTDQAYDLVISPEAGVLLRAADPVGLAYGVATVLQLLRVHDGLLLAPACSLEDEPACEIRGPITVPTSTAWLDFCAFFKLNAWFSGAGGSEQVTVEANRRGIRLMPARHLPDEFDFQSTEALDEYTGWALEAADKGYRWLTINADDRPNEVFTAEDRERFGPGFAGLGKAHAAFINRLKPRLGGRIEVVFCPRVYYEVGADYTAADAEDQRAYLTNLSAELAEPLTCWITQVTPEFLRQSAERFGAPPLAWHNFFPGDTADWKVYYEAYPIVGDPASARGFFVLGNTREAQLWRPNYVTFAANTWNPQSPIGLREAFTALHGVGAGAALTRYAELTGGHDRPIGVMADFWDQPQEVAPRFLASGWAGVLPKAEATPELLQRCLALSASAAEAAQLPLAETGVPAEMAERLRLEARRTHLAFGLWAHRLAGKLGQTLDTGDPEAMATELKAILEGLELDKSAADWGLVE